eukprot:CAMPEP_0176035472 /NCGR_PEP_ID=MMETSP0120_2-20121206/17551_1 /TAXON_ID=160619 /ORGANISM="Kryptoperidinium foliaceum, Strain CCMP 1326" /LENGTH=446 /DNA_ID=CAMNT_0017368835 /DNA_START=70 /DNA_END=1406 /DNA_ORIENTATION=-
MRSLWHVIRSSDAEAPDHEAVCPQPRSEEKRARWLLAPLVLLALVSAAIHTFARSSPKTQVDKPEFSILAHETQGRDVVGIRGYVKARGGTCLLVQACCGVAPMTGPCGEDPRQQWVLTEEGLLWHDFGGCLDRGDGKLHMQACDPRRRSQIWKYDTRSGRVRGVGGDDERCVSNPAPGTDRLPATLAECGDASGQRWSIGVRVGAVQLAADACFVRDGSRTLLTTCSSKITSAWALAGSKGVSSLRQGYAKSGSNTCLNTGPCCDGQLYHGPCGNDLLQSWTFKDGRLQHGYGACMARVGSKVLVKDCDSKEPSQNWKYDPDSGRISPAGDEGICLEAGTNSIALTKCHSGVPGQKWEIPLKPIVTEFEASTCLESRGHHVGLGQCRPGSSITWEFDASLGQLIHQASRSCATKGAHGQVVLDDCSEHPDEDDTWRQHPDSLELA